MGFNRASRAGDTGDPAPSSPPGPNNPADQFGELDFDGLDEPARRFEIRDESGELRATLVRTPDKAIWWEGPDGAPGLGGVKARDLPLYRASRLNRVPLEVPVVVTEGPKDCEALWRANIPAVGTMTGASGLPSMASLEVLRDRIVDLWPDNDEAGYRHMQSMADALTGVAKEIRWLQIPGLPPKAGAADVPVEDIPRLFDTYARVARTCVGRSSTPMRDKEESESLSLESPPTYAHARVGTRRYSGLELAEMRRAVDLRFNAPSDSALRELSNALERIQGRLVRQGQLGYLIRCYRIHGPATTQLLVDLFRERGTVDNLLLALELTPPTSLAEVEERSATSETRDQNSVSEARKPAEQPEPDLALGASAQLDGWRCGADRGSGHVSARRPDGSIYCGTCHPAER